MPTFTIDPDNNITAVGVASTDAGPDRAFSSEEELANLTANWPVSRLIQIWNSFAGVAPFNDLRPVKKFTSRNVAVARIWSAAERLAVGEAQAVRKIAPVPKRSKNAPGKVSRGGQSRKHRKESRVNKKAEVVAMMRRAKGATLGEIEAATGWQKHTIRGLVSILGSQGGMKIESAKNASGERTYRILK
jgi:hypothetical protein